MEKIYKVLKKIEGVEPTWQCEITRKIDADGKAHIYRTHLRSVSPLIGKFLSSLILIAKPKTILELGCSGDIQLCGYLYRHERQKFTQLKF